MRATTSTRNSFSTSGVIRVQTLHDLDAEDEDFTLTFTLTAAAAALWTRRQDGDRSVTGWTGTSQTLTIKDDETQSYDLTTDDDEKLPTEGR